MAESMVQLKEKVKVHKLVDLTVGQLVGVTVAMKDLK
jgi:hypothetical protein